MIFVTYPNFIHRLFQLIYASERRARRTYDNPIQPDTTQTRLLFEYTTQSVLCNLCLSEFFMRVLSIIIVYYQLAFACEPTSLDVFQTTWPVFYISIINID